MLCPNCNANIFDGETFCPACGTTVSTPTTVYYAPKREITSEEELPEQYRPLSPWGYFALSLLFSVPIVGFIFLIIFSIKKSNINRRNFARSFWCAYIIVAAILVIYLFVAAFFMGSVAGIGAMRYY